MRRRPKIKGDTLDLVFSGRYVKILVDVATTEMFEDGGMKSNLSIFFGYYLASDENNVYLGTMTEYSDRGIPQLALNKRYIIVIEFSDPKTEQDIILDEVPNPSEEEIN
jgi:hypothetical protein